MFLKLVIVFIFLCLSISDCSIRLETDPPVIEIGFTNSFVIACFVSGDSESGDVNVDSIIISKTNENYTDVYKELASITAFVGHVVELSPENALISGAINGTHMSYLRLTWDNPSFDRAGLYRCEASGVDAIGHRYTYVSVSIVSVEAPDIDVFLMEMQSVFQEVTYTDSLQTLGEERFLILEKAKLSTFDISTTYKDSTYYLSYSDEYVNSYQAQATCQMYGGYLAEMDSSDELTFIRNYIRGLTRKAHRDTILIGGTNEDWCSMYQSSVDQSFTMRSLAILAVAFFGCVMSQDFDQIFNRYAGSDNQFSQAEFSRFWLHFDDDGDGDVTKQEFDQGWRQENFPNPQNAPLFFLELDRVADEVLNAQDFPHIFHMFDEDGNGSISEREFRFNWNAYFDD